MELIRGKKNLMNAWFYVCVQFLTENTDFTVVGVIGPPGAGKSTIMNELYGFNGTSPGGCESIYPNSILLFHRGHSYYSLQHEGIV